MAIKKTESTPINIPAINIQEFDLRLVGDSPLIVHAWSDKAKKMMLDKQMKKATSGREAKDPFQDFTDSLYWLTEKPEKPTIQPSGSGMTFWNQFVTPRLTPLRLD